MEKTSAIQVAVGLSGTDSMDSVKDGGNSGVRASGNCLWSLRSMVRLGSWPSRLKGVCRRSKLRTDRCRDVHKVFPVSTIITIATTIIISDSMHPASKLCCMSHLVRLWPMERSASESHLLFGRSTAASRFVKGLRQPHVLCIYRVASMQSITLCSDGSRNSRLVAHRRSSLIGKVDEPTASVVVLVHRGRCFRRGSGGL